MSVKAAITVIWKITLFILLIYTVLAIMIYIISPQNASVVNGRFDLSDYEFEEDGVLWLNGEWEFFPDQLLDPGINTDQTINKKSPYYIKVPGTWKDYQYDGKTLPGFGYATYRLSVTGITPDIPLSLKILPQSTAYNVFIDNELVASSGKVSASKDLSAVEYEPHSIQFTPTDSDFIITIQISNYAYAYGGMWDSPTLGTQEQIVNLDRNITYRDLFLFGNYLIMFFLCIIIFIFRKDNRSGFYFAILCVISICRLSIYGEHLILFATDNFRIITFVEYATRYWYPILFMLLLNEEFPGIIPKKKANGFVVLIAGITIGTIFLPIHIYTLFSGIVIWYVLLTSLFILIILILSANNDRMKWLFIFGLSVFYGSSVFDILFAKSAYLEMNPIGFYIALLSFAYIIANHYANALTKSEEAFKELEITSELKHQTELKLLQSQIKPHFLYNALSAIAYVCRKDPQKAEHLILDLAFFLQASFDFSSFDRMTTLERELDFIKNYIHIEKARFGDRVNYREQIEVPLTTQVPGLIIEPLVENAIRHGISRKKGGGEVSLTVTENQDGIRIEVYDNGVGMNEQKIVELFQDAENNNGIGLKNIQDRLIKLYGQGLLIESIPNAYTKISFTMKKEI